MGKGLIPITSIYEEDDKRHKETLAIVLNKGRDCE